MSRPNPVVLALSVLTMLAMLAVDCSVVFGQDSPAVGWSLDTSDPALLGKITDTYLYEGSTNKQLGSGFSLAVKDDVLRINGSYGVGGKNLNDYVHLSIPIPDGLDLTKYPVFEIEWRSDGPQPAATLLVNVRAVTKSGDDATAYYYPLQPAKPGEWVMATNHYVQDAGNPTRGTPVRVNSWELHTYVHNNVGDFSFEIRSFKARAINAAEAAVVEPRMELLRNYQNIPVPEPWATRKFPFGLCASCRGPEGYESWYDNVVRVHGNINIFHMSQGPDWKGFSDMVPAEEFIAARKKELAAAAPRGLYNLHAVGFVGMMNKKGPDGLPWMREYAGQLAKAFRNEPHLAGWFIADECSDEWLWGLAATKDALDKADPTKINIMNHFEINRILRFEPYLNAVMTDYYPITQITRNPWAIAGWCRTMDERSDRPHWIFVPAFGEAEWWKCAPGYQFPTRAETRLVGYLALANGAKGISYFAYSFPNTNLPDFAGVFSALGHAIPLDDPIAQDISVVGEKLAEIGPFLLQAKLLPKDAASAKAESEGDKPLSVGVRQLKDGSALLVVVNESVEKPQAGNVTLSAKLVGSGRRVYDTSTLAEIPLAGDSFAVGELIAGDGRIYFTGSQEQFKAVKKAILTNRAQEILRIANLDLLVARRWGVNVKAVDNQFAKARAAATRGDVQPAREAQKMVAALMKGKSEFAQARGLFLETKNVLGRAFYEIVAGRVYAADGLVAWPGNEAMLDQPAALWNRFGPLQEDYYLGKRQGLSGKMKDILNEGKALLAKARGNRQRG